MVLEISFEDEPSYVISIASRIAGVHAQSLRYYERVGLISPSRSVGRQRLYTQKEVQKLRRIKTLTEDLGVNLAGVEVILKLMDRVAVLDVEVKRLSAELRHLKTSSTESTHRIHPQEA